MVVLVRVCHTVRIKISIWVEIRDYIWVWIRDYCHIFSTAILTTSKARKNVSVHLCSDNLKAKIRKLALIHTPDLFQPTRWGLTVTNP